MEAEVVLLMPKDRSRKRSRRKNSIGAPVNPFLDILCLWYVFYVKCDKLLHIDIILV